MNNKNINLDRIKYPRTYHVPWSPSPSKDDKVLKDMSSFENQQVIITMKMDGENTTLYRDYIHARSLDYEPHESRTWVKTFWSQICGDIPENFRICGENLYAKHSIHYDNLPTYFMGFSIWDKLNCLSWDETIEYFELLGIQHVPVLYDGIFDIEKIKNLKIDFEKDEGYVIRLKQSFEYKDFKKSVAKYVRKNHVTSDTHWKFKKLEKNTLRRI